MEITLPKKLEEAAEDELFRWTIQAVQAMSQRDNDMMAYNDLMLSLNMASANTRWNGASEVGVPLILSQHIGLLSFFTEALRRDPKIAVTSFDDDDEDNAGEIEAFFAKKTSDLGLDRYLYNGAYNSISSYAAIGYAGWKTETKPVLSTGYFDKAGALVQSEDRIEGETYDERQVLSHETRSGHDFRVVPLSDFYMYPPTSREIGGATAVMERLRFTAEQLVDGIQSYGYDEDAVYDLISQAPQYAETEQLSRDSRESETGISGSSVTRSRDTYEIYMAHFRLPVMPASEEFQEAEDRLPDYMMQSDFLAVYDPIRRICLKCAICSEAERPYYPGYIMPRPDSFYGLGLPMILDGLQAEANANANFNIDSMNVTMSPPILAKRTLANEFSKFQTYPGAVWAVDDPQTDVMVMRFDRGGYAEGLQHQQWIDAQADKIMAAEGASALGSKVLKNNQTEAIVGQISAKRGMFLGNFMDSFVQETYRRCLALQIAHMGDDEEEFVLGGKKHTISAQKLKKRYDFHAVATSQTASPETRLQVVQQKQTTQLNYFMAIQKFPDHAEELWYGARQVYVDWGDPNPEQWIGKKPQSGPPMMPGMPPGGQPGQPQGQPQGAPPQQGQMPQ